MSVSLSPSSWVIRILERGTLSYLTVRGWSLVFWSRCERAVCLSGQERAVCPSGQAPDREATRCAHLQGKPLLQSGLPSSGPETLCFPIMTMSFQSCAGSGGVCQLCSVGWGQRVSPRDAVFLRQTRRAVLFPHCPGAPASPPVLRPGPPLNVTGAPASPPVLPSRCPLRPPPELTSAVHPECLGSGSIGVTASQLCPGWLRTCSLGSLNWETDRHPSTSDAQVCGFRLLCCCCGFVFVVSDLKKTVFILL